MARQEASTALLIRDIAPEDHDRLVALWIAAWQRVMPQIDFAARAGFIAEEIVRFSIAPKQARLVEAPKGSPQGFILVDLEACILEQIVVSPAAQGSGVSDLLIAEAKKLSPKRLELRVNRDNPRAIAFYTRHGFAITGEGLNSASGLPVLTMEWRA